MNAFKTMETKKLHISDNIEALDKLALDGFKAYTNRTKVESLTIMAGHLHKKILSDQSDQESAYIICKRYLKILELITKLRDDNKFMAARYDSERNQVANLMINLKDQLKLRYKSLQDEKQRQSAKHLFIEQPKVAPKEISVKQFHNGFIKCKELYSLLSVDNMLLVDIRPEQEYLQSRITYKNSINIPGDVIAPGLSANTLGHQLPSATKAIWDKRDSFSILILIDWNSSSDISSTKLETLRSFLIDWDFNRKYELPPAILEGGFQEFIETYPSSVDNSHIYLIRQNGDLDELLDIDDVTYPDQDSNGNNMSMSNVADIKIEDETEPTEFAAANAATLDADTKETNGDFSDRAKSVVSSETSNSSIESENEYENQQIKQEIENARQKELNKARSLKHSFDKSVNSINIINSYKTTIPTINRNMKPIVPLISEENTVGFTGLKNIRNNCYMNTVLQCLRCVPPFRGLFVKDLYASHQVKKPPNLLYETAEVMKAIDASPSEVHNPIAFIQKVAELEPIYGRANHEDCMEFFLFFLNTLSDDCAFENKLLSSSMSTNAKAWYNQLQGRHSVFIQLFFHLIRTDRSCNSCKISSYSFEADSTIMLPMPERNCSLVDLLDEYFQEFDIMDYCCSKCKKPVKNKKICVTCSQVLVLVLKRYYQNSRLDFSKNNYKVDFPTENLEFKMASGGVNYKLVSMALHSGNLVSGHYTAGCLINHKWVEISDETVKELDIKGHRAQSLVCAFFYYRT